MAIQRRTVGSATLYRGGKIEAKHCGPDLLCYVDGVELGGFYASVEGVRKAGMRHIDAQLKEESEQAAATA